VCTLTLAWNVLPGTPVAAAANRDEALDRPSEPPRVRPREGDVPGVVAPRDARAGGTWVGCTDEGLYVTVTNRWLDAEIDGDRSRGLLVDECLRRSSARAAAEYVRGELAERAYAGFFLILADRTDAFLLAYDGELETVRLDPGVHVVSNVGGILAGTPRFSIPDRRREPGVRRRESAVRLFEHLRLDSHDGGANDADAEAWTRRAREALADHDFGACVHGDGYGTRSGTVVRVGPGIDVEYADGPPCRTEYDPIEIPDSWPRP
jgi:uncharacterized protein with NRDE domain